MSGSVWYSGGYRAQVVAYTLAKLNHLIESTGKGHLDTSSIWQHQGISPAGVNQLGMIAEEMFRVVMAPPPGVQNVGEWCKKELCWERAKAAQLTLTEAMIAELVGAASIRSEDRSAKADQRQYTGITAQITVVQLGHAYWTDLKSWADDRRLLTSADDRLVRLAAGMLPGLPNDKQSTRLLQLKSVMELEGFAPVAPPT